MKLVMAALLAISAAPQSADPIAQDRKDFEHDWLSEEKGAAEAGISKELTWKVYEWTQVQFAFGYCSGYVKADTMERLRHFPDEDKLMETERGRALLTNSNASFREGMDYRKEVAPSAALCQRELDKTLKRLSAIGNQ